MTDQRTSFIIHYVASKECTKEDPIWINTNALDVTTYWLLHNIIYNVTK